jgi:hypothetical protein
VEYLVQRARALGCEDVRVGELPLQGKNTVIYWLGHRPPSPNDKPPRSPFCLDGATFNGDVVDKVCAFLDVQAVWGLGALSKDWLHWTRLHAKSRVAEFVSLLQQRVELRRVEPDKRKRAEVVADSLMDGGGGRARFGNVAELLAGVRGKGMGDALEGAGALGLVAVVHSIARGPAYLGRDKQGAEGALLLERAGVYIISR